jgi:hypothetical protein
MSGSSGPGCRAPHFWLADGRSLYDAFGQGYTLLRFDARVDVLPLLAAAQERRVPMKLVDITGVAVPGAYRHPLVVCRDDQHVAWRGVGRRCRPIRSRWSSCCAAVEARPG